MVIAQQRGCEQKETTFPQMSKSNRPESHTNPGGPLRRPDLVLVSASLLALDAEGNLKLGLRTGET